MTILDSFDIEELLLSSNLQSDAVESWIENFAYSMDSKVEYDGKIYISVSENNSGNIPPDSPLKWDYERPSNPKAVFDDYPSTVSTNIDEDIILEFESNDTNILAMGSLGGKEIIIELIDIATGDELETRAIPLYDYSEPQDIYDYFFIFPKLKKRIHYIGLFTPYWGSKLKITIKKDNGSASIGFLKFGIREKIACTILDTVTWRDEADSEIKRIRGKLQPLETVGGTQLSLPFSASIQNLYEVRRTLVAYRGKPIVVLGDDTGENLAYTMIGRYSHIEEDSDGYRGKYTMIVNSMDEII